MTDHKKATHQIRYPNVTGSQNVGWGHCTHCPWTWHNFIRCCWHSFILTSILNANFLAQTISDMNRKSKSKFHHQLKVPIRLVWVSAYGFIREYWN